VAKKKEEPAKPVATQLIFQAPSLPTPAVDRPAKKKAEPKPERKERKKKEAPKEKLKPQKEKKKEEDGSTRVKDAGTPEIPVAADQRLRRANSWHVASL
jgi:hypothetical protein